MKIQNINNYINYKGSSKPVKADESLKAKNYDVIEIKNKSQVDKEALTVNSIKNKVVSQINEESNAEKISKLKESVNNKTYKVDVEEIVNKLLRQ